MVRCPYLWKPVTVLLFSNLVVGTCSLNYVLSAPSLGGHLSRYCFSYSNLWTSNSLPHPGTPIRSTFGGPYLRLEASTSTQQKLFKQTHPMNLGESHWGGDDSLMWWGYERQLLLRRWDFAKFSFSKRKHWNLKIQVLILEHLRLIKKSVWDKNPKFVALCERLGFVIKKKKPTSSDWLKYHYY